MAKENNSGKWAAEAYDFIKLFQRTGEQLSGLFLLELGWTILIVTLVKLSPANTTPVIELPSFSKTTGWVFAEFHLSSVYSTGVIGILLAWLFVSKISMFLFAPLRQLLRQIAIILLQVSFYVLMIFIGIPVFIPLFFIEQMKFKRWKKTRDQDKLKAYLKEHGKSGEKALLDLARKEMKFNAEWIFDQFSDLFALLMQNVVSVGYIGFASIQSVSFEEEQKATQLYSQVFASAINKLRLSLSQLKSVPHIKFTSLPAMIVPRDVDTANFLKKWLGLEILLWGSYLTESHSDVWLNIQQEQLEKPEQSDETRTSFDEIDIFPGLYSLKYSMVVIHQNNLLDAYIVLLVAIILSMRSRRQYRFRLHSEYFDRLRFGHHDEQVLITSLIRDVLFSVPLESNPNQTLPTASRILVDLAGRWVSDKLNDYSSYGLYSKDFHLLKDVAKRSIEIVPDDADGYYRLSAIYCLIDDYPNADKYLKAGMERDKFNPWLNPLSAQIRADTEFSTKWSPIGMDDKIELTRFAMYTARAIAIDVNGDNKKNLAEKYVKENMLYDGRKLNIFRDPLLVPELLIQELLEIDLSPKNSESQDKPEINE